MFDDIYRLEEIDDRFDYGEERWRIIGELYFAGERFCIAVVVWTDRDGSVRIISARKANKREVRTYETFKLFEKLQSED